ncbi:DNA primase [Ligilactobacillus agilis]|uniref:DNA primase n=1 Tax=Ligilactobacillus agilis TaxID=1601 RepID=UPI001F58DC08|nr:DNA primase [Ligilactobacillus agilis]UNL43241.1 DNA primase [Ligilactobacillus agilis]UNL57758.1 DNA primase [Ligilactobacillus agilis]
MSLIPAEVIDRVRTSVNILDVVGQSVQMHKSGKNWFGLCPFHPEKTPSFSVNEEKQIFTCFSCHRGGNVFKFLMELNGVTFPEAVKQVAQIAGIEIATDVGQTAAEKNSPRQKLYQLYNRAADLYHHVLINTKLGQEAFSYLQDRGLSLELIKEFRIGFAPEQPLLEELFKKEEASDYQLVRKSGLFLEWQDGSLHERFVDRIMFPINNQAGQVVAFSGRLLHANPQAPKYLNSPETAIFNKSKVLFNFDKAKGEIRLKQRVILFEGFMDVLAAYRSGVKNGVASMGTSLTDEQVYQLKRLTNQVCICYDGDDPGQLATKRALELFESQGSFNLSVINLPENLDPDEYVKKYGEEKFAQAVAANQVGALDFYLQYFERGKNLATENDQLLYLRQVLEVLAPLKDKIQQDLYLNRLSKRFKLEKLNLEAQLRDLQTKLKVQTKPLTDLKTSAVVPPVEKQAKVSQVITAQRLLFYRLLHEQGVFLRLMADAQFHFFTEIYQRGYLVAQAYFVQHEDYNSAEFLDFIKEEPIRQLVVSLEMTEFPPQALPEEIDDCIIIITKLAPLLAKLDQNDQEFERAMSLGNTEEAQRLLVEKIKLKQQIAQVKQALH